ncbi:DUF2306 domain-containing protein [Rubrivirga sp.]|uniref:DUF2306 domain-containing protein n=1 Tax=Rubrivirga sp. TaxID=1885344 RepID=UPI003B521E86
MTPIALVHTALGVTALATGAFVLVRRKGDRLHRVVGRVYAGALVALCVLSFGLRDSTPFFHGYGPFHVAALVSLGTVTAGVVVARRRRENWLGAHYMWMAWSYIGLVMATGGHVVHPIVIGLRGMGVPGAVSVAVGLAVAWVLPPLVGRWWIARQQPGWDALGTRVPA